jgi:hypothetical protein
MCREGRAKRGAIRRNNYELRAVVIATGSYVVAYVELVVRQGGVSKPINVRIGPSATPTWLP